MQITREQVQQSVYVILRQQAETLLLQKTPDEYYGWVPPTLDKKTKRVTTPGYWLGEQDDVRARQAVADAEAQVVHTKRLQRRAHYEHQYAPAEDAAVAQAEEQLSIAQAHAARIQQINALAITKRRELLIEKKAQSLFIALYRRAMTLKWNLYHPSVSDDLRRYLQFWRKDPHLTPSSVVFLYVTLLETIAHGDSHQTEAISGNDYMAAIPLVRARLNVNACEDQPSRADREYIKALRTQLAYDTRPDAHENLDRRDVLADWRYDGLPDQLGSLWLDKNDGHECENCHEKLTTKTVHSPKGYALAETCPNHIDRPGCTHRPLTPRFATKTDLRDHLCLQWAHSNAA